MKKDISTEQKIKDAARAVFIAKGFSGCSTREIAKVAGMNFALVNYYFRSKSQLFQLIFNAAMEDFTNTMVEVFSRDLTLPEKMKILIEKEYEFLSQHPELPSFIIQETNRESEIAHDNLGFFQKISNTGIFQQCLEAQQKGEMREINIFNLTLLILSNCHYPFMSRNMLKGMLKLEDAQLIPNIEIHKKHVSDLLIAYLFPKISNNEE
ncbi:MAG: TetR/AcrR family transcriptional regulator [Bacteroidota bacterium]